MAPVSEPSGHARPHQNDAAQKIYQHYRGQGGRDAGDSYGDSDGAGDHGGDVGSA